MEDRNVSAGEFWLNECKVVPDQNLIGRGTEEVSINPRSMAVLLALVERHGEIVSSEELFEQIWPANHISGNTVYKAINELRNAFGDSSKHSNYIETKSRKGYRLVAEINPDNRVSERSKPRVFRLAAVSIAAVLVVAISGWFAIDWTSADRCMEAYGKPCGPAPPTSLAILQFENSDTDPRDESPTEDIVRSILTGLSEIERIRTSSLANSFRFSTQEQSIDEIADALQVEHILEGSVQRSSGRLRVSVQLTRVADGINLYSQQFDRKIGDNPKIQQEIATKIVTALEIHLDENERELMLFNGTSNAQAWAAFKSSNKVATGNNVADLLRSIEQSKAVITLDPNFTEAYIVIARDLARLSTLMAPEQFAELNAQMTTLMREARENGASEEVKRIIALNQAEMNADLVEKERILRRRIQNPPPEDEFEKRHYGFYYSEYGALLRQAGLFAEGDAYHKQGVIRCQDEGRCKDFDIARESISTVLWRDGPESVVPLYKEFLTSNPASIPMLTGLASWLSRLGRFEEAERYLQQLEQTDETGLYAHHVRFRIAVYQGELTSDNTAFQDFLRSPLVTDLF